MQRQKQWLCGHSFVSSSVQYMLLSTVLFHLLFWALSLCELLGIIKFTVIFGCYTVASTEVELLQ